MKRTLTLATAVAALTTTGALAGSMDFGAMVEKMMQDNLPALFGVSAPLAASAPSTEGAYRGADQAAADQVLLAEGLSAAYLSRDVANKLDMFALYPAANPTHLIACVEGGREEIAAGKMNPSVQRIALDGSSVETIVRGMDRCDGIRTTAWGTVLATEETEDGAAYEILDPLEMAEVTVIDRDSGETTDPTLMVKRPALPTMAWEGLTVLDSGVVIGGDELRPGTAYPGTDGGALFKFVPAEAHAGGMIDSLDASPLSEGASYALRVSCVNKKEQYGQGCEVGNGAWVAIDPARARVGADLAGATGFYRPEDLHVDPVYAGEGVRFCWTNTGNTKAGNYGEVMCGVDRAPLNADAGALNVVINRFIEGDSELNAPDNLAFNPVSGLLYVVEDNENGDIWACLPDGADRDIKSDGCIRVLSVKDSSAEPTGFMFSQDGTQAYVSIQHSDDANMAKVDDYGTDDLLVISGFSK
ncbi:alkaline phosphatase PhoX [Actibacterium sp. MT2.3-13A]|uniref:alkaline phosphatase PhoX n=1 Tax=Actibacterium sp. MT2.3-13A TaxID=2828332 RepID=UPI001BA7C54D|nr:alkaline phosphatase PhoX [Actibacterium sp. MT2.3-13A]